MSSAALDLLADLVSRGVRLEPEGGDVLFYHAPAGILTPKDKARMRAVKSDLIPLLLNPRRAAFLAWEMAMSGIADRWEAHAAEASAAGREPAWICDEVLTADVRAMINACRVPDDLAPALEAIGRWGSAWEEALGALHEERNGKSDPGVGGERRSPSSGLQGKAER